MLRVRLPRRRRPDVPTTFGRTIRALAADSVRPSAIGLGTISLVLGAWIAWFVVARVPLYEVTETGRIEVAAAVQPVEAPVGGRIVLTHLEIGRRVQAGDVLVELESDFELAAAEARQWSERANAKGAAAADHAERLRKLAARGLVAQAELVQAEGEARHWRAASNAERIASERLDRERDRRRIRAPATGRLAEVAVLRVGAVIREGEKLGSIVPAGQLRAVADFPPPVLGRLRVGQPARLRLHGFPSTQFGSIGAVVTNVAGDAREGRVRTELALQREERSRIQVQHGLPASVEVEVERLSPLALVFRIAGRLVGVPGSLPASDSMLGR